MLFRQIYDRYLSQYAYLVGCQQTKEALIVDPQRDVDRYFAAAEEEGLTLVAAAETHIHADYLSGLRALAETYGLMVYVSGADDEWRYAWLDGSSLPYRLLQDGDTFQLGNVVFDVLHTPGHTPEHLTYLIIDRSVDDSDGVGLITGDFVFVGDVGRPDLLESADGQIGKMRPAARELFRSIRQFRGMPPWLQVWPAHGAGSACGKALGAVPQSTVGYEVRRNPAIATADQGEDAFVDAILEGQPEPPLYFKRMKHLNRDGPPLLPALPRPRPMAAGELAGLAGRTDIALVDTRPRDQFLASHLSGALHAPFDSTFCTVVGSYVEPQVPIYLIVEPDDLDEAVRCLVRIGLDDVAGSFAQDDAEAFLSGESDQESMDIIDFTSVMDLLEESHALVVDVRSRSEFEGGHIPGAVNAPFTRLPEHFEALAGDRDLIVHCATGVRSAVAAAMLQRHGFRVHYVEDDWENYVRQGGKVE